MAFDKVWEGFAHMQAECHEFTEGGKKLLCYWRHVGESPEYISTLEFVYIVYLIVILAMYSAVKHSISDTVYWIVFTLLLVTIAIHVFIFMNIFYNYRRAATHLDAKKLINRNTTYTGYLWWATLACVIACVQSVVVLASVVDRHKESIPSVVVKVFGVVTAAACLILAMKELHNWWTLQHTPVPPHTSAQPTRA